jgi:competence protein ComEC
MKNQFIKIGRSIKNIDHTLFWKQNPALFYSLSLLIGTSSTLFLDTYLWAFVWLIYLLFSRAYPQIAILGASLFYGSFYHLPSSIPEHEISAIFSPSRLQPHHSPFQKGIEYKGTIFYQTHALPVSIYMRDKLENRPPANKSYHVKGDLIQRDTYSFAFKPREWIPIKHSWSLAELRYQTKEKFKKHIAKHLPSSRVAILLSSMTTGNVEDRMLRYEFGRLGLQHILAISGFHFGILIAFLSFFLRLALPHAWKIFTLFLLITAYYIFIGSSPAIERSYLTALFYLLGKWMNRQTSGLNLLGCAMGTETLMDPFVSGNIGFQLSFFSCFAILILYPPIEKKIQFFLPKRTKGEIHSLTVLSQHGYLFSSFFRKSISLTLAVNIALLPLLLFHFHQFPCLSLIYNIFFPSAIGISIFLLLSAFLFHLLFPPIANLLYWATNSFTDFLLELSANPLLPLDFSIQTSDLSAHFVILFCFVFGFFCIQNKCIDEYSLFR